MRWIVVAAVVCVGFAAPAAAQDAKAKGAQLFADQKSRCATRSGTKATRKARSTSGEQTVRGRNP